MGLSGRACAEYFLDRSIQVTGLDKNFIALAQHDEIKPLIKKGLKLLSDQDCMALAGFDFIVASPGIPPTHSLIKAAEGEGKPVFGEVDLACCLLENPMIGITGTNGKTTVTLLTEHVFLRSGIKAKAVGNVGIPLISEVAKVDRETLLVVELSSYQIESLSGPVLDCAVLLNITPDHLDRYPSMDHYAMAKCHLKHCLKQSAPFFVDVNAYRVYSSMLEGPSILQYGFDPHLFINADSQCVYRNGQRAFELPDSLKGQCSHDVENLMAAFAICSHFGIQGKEFISAFNTFKKPPHRIEFVCELSGIRFFDDSKGTNIDAVMRAVDSIQGPIILIAGGVDKGAAYTPWIARFHKKVKSICAIGQAAGKIEKELSGQLPVSQHCSLDDAVDHAYRQASPGDTVLLSPGCSSFDMFLDYAHRGFEFQRLVKNLPSKSYLKENNNND